MRSEYAIRFDYGSIVPWVTRQPDNSIRAVAGPDMAVLRTDIAMKPKGRMHRAEFVVKADQTVSFVLSYEASHRHAPEPIDPQKALKATLSAWDTWGKQGVRCGEYSEAVMRSLVTLKTLTYQPTGGIVAAPTTSLPETLGGHRNWDYRYCWLRDATFTLLAFMNSGFLEEADAWRQWLRRAVAGDPAQVQIMYGLLGERRLDEWEVPWLAGYEGAKPVRIGNAAATQLQLDIYGEVLDALFQGGINGLSADHAAWDVQNAMLEHLEAVWQEPDEGIWEVRGGEALHALKVILSCLDQRWPSKTRFRVPRALAGARKSRERAEAAVRSVSANAAPNRCERAAHSRSAFQLCRCGVSTVDAMERARLDGPVRRYDPRRTKDGPKTREGAFRLQLLAGRQPILLGRREDANTCRHLLIAQ
jgi:GH15 family glucan-1,4-alpha-glucosidase